MRSQRILGKEQRQLIKSAENLFGNESLQEIKTFLKLLGCNLDLWALYLIFSERFRKLFVQAHKYLSIDQEKNLNILEVIILSPFQNMLWLNKAKQIIKNYPATDQANLGICWSHAIATAIHLSQSRIIGRPVESFASIRQKLLSEFGYSGQNSRTIMERVLPRYNLKFQKVSPKVLSEIISNGRVCVARFYLTGVQWHNFCTFFRDPETKKRAITKSDLNRDMTSNEKHVYMNPGGHAVVLIDATSDEWTFLNSWGEEWGDCGKFRMKTGAIEIKFYDIFWYISDLTQTEINLYKNLAFQTATHLFQIVNEIDIILEQKKDDLKNHEIDSQLVVEACSKIGGLIKMCHIPIGKEIDELIVMIKDFTGGVIAKDEIGHIQIDDQIIIEMTPQQNEKMISFLASFLSKEEVEARLKDLFDRFCIAEF